MPCTASSRGHCSGFVTSGRRPHWLDRWHLDAVRLHQKTRLGSFTVLTGGGPCSLFRSRQPIGVFLAPINPSLPAREALEQRSISRRKSSRAPLVRPSAPFSTSRPLRVVRSCQGLRTYPLRRWATVRSLQRLWSLATASALADLRSCARSALSGVLRRTARRESCATRFVGSAFRSSRT